MNQAHDSRTDSAVKAAYGSFIGCALGIVVAIYFPKYDWTPVMGFVGGTLIGAAIPFLMIRAPQPSPLPVSGGL